MMSCIGNMAEKTVSDLATDHLYYADTYLYSCNSKVLRQYDAVHNGETLLAIVLDRTVMHPQGGGQPTDVGCISSITDPSNKFEVCHVQKTFGANYIEHIGKYTRPDHISFSVGEEVTVNIDSSRRRFNARLHSAGHLLDSAFINLGMTDLIPSKGYHFPDGPYVEYIGNIPAEKRAEVIASLNATSDQLIKNATAVRVTMNEKGEREVNVGGTGCMCGGTHVKNTSEIIGLTVTKIKKSKKNIRVSYTIAEQE